jgi:hypothetical protein
MMTALLSLIAFSVNLGRLSNSMAKLQNSSDASGRGAAWKLMERFGKTDATQLATAEAQTIVQSTMTNRGIDHTLIPESDLKFGTYSWDPVTLSFKTTWGASPTNLVQTKLSRLDVRANALDVVLRRFLGRDTVELKTLTNVVFMPATGFLPPTGSQTLEILPFTLDIDTWIALENGVGSDDFTVNPVTNAVTPGRDGVLEVKIFPIGPNKNLPSGNRGTLRLGANNNSTSKLSRQIRYGLNASDMSHHPNGFSVADGPINLPGDPGVSAAIENDLIAILGQDRILPIFTSVNGNGANASYSIVKFVGVKVVKADLRGALNHKAVVLQPSNFAIEEATTNMKMPLNQSGTIFVKPTFINLD